MELAGRLDNDVEIAILDMGFVPSANFPAGIEAISNVPGVAALGSSNISNCGTPCPWHGTGVVTAAMEVPDNDFGGAGPAGPVADPILVYTLPDFITSIAAVLRARARGADIINMSYRARVPAVFTPAVLPFNLTTAAVRASGALIFAAAGNDDANIAAKRRVFGVDLWEKAWYTPVENDGVIGVGALANNSQFRAGYSNFGNEDVDIWAPGTVWVGPDPSNPGNSARQVRGTSIASPFAAGVAALIWAADPSQSAGEVADTLFDTMQASPDRRVNGYVNAADAVFSTLGDVHPLVDINIPSDGASYSHRVNAYFAADAEDLEDGLLSGDSVIWTSDRDGEFGRGTDVTTNRLSLGEHVITVAARDSEGHVTTDEVTITVVNDEPIMTLDSPGDDSRFCEGQRIMFDATSVDINNRPRFELNDSAVVWRSARDGTLGTGHDIVTELSLGTHMITVTGSDGLSADSDSITVHVSTCLDQPPVATVVNPSGDVALVFDGFDTDPGMWYTDVTLEGAASDTEDGRLTGDSLIWMTNRPGLADTVRRDGRDILGAGGRLTVRLYSDDPFGAEHELTLIAVDSAGNESSPVLRRVRLWTLG
jgi:hypothetical protein